MKLRRLFQPWLLILIGGAVLFVATEQVLILTGDPNFFPTVILLGAFVVPVAFVTFFYEHVRHREISLPLLTTCFIAGGVLGVLAAGLLEYGTLLGLGIPSLLSVGLIEESAKLIFPVIVFIGWRYRHEADGLLFGIAAGMGFAALETMGYGLASFVRSRGDMDILQQVLILRGFLSPAGHAAWTGFVCAVLWRERERRGHIAISFPFIGALFLAILLHTLWNGVNGLGGLVPSNLVVNAVGSGVLAAASLALLVHRYREAKRSL